MFVKWTLEGVEKFLSLILIPVIMHLSRSIGALILFLVHHVCKIKALRRVLKVINNCSYLAVNALIEYVNYRFYTAHEKEAIATKFSPANLF